MITPEPGQSELLVLTQSWPERLHCSQIASAQSVLSGFSNLHQIDTEKIAVYSPEIKASLWANCVSHSTLSFQINHKECQND